MGGSFAKSNENILPSDVQDLRRQFGNWMKAAREQSGLSIDSIAQETRISKAYIANLESGHLEHLPGKVFGRGFVKNITRLLKSDATEGLRLYDACWGTTASGEVETKKTEPKPQDIETKVTSATLSSLDQTPSKVAKSQTESITPPPQLSIPTLDSKVARSVANNPQMRLSLLATVAFIFVATVFGQWVKGQFKNASVSQESPEQIASTVKSEADPALQTEAIPQDPALQIAEQNAAVPTEQILEKAAENTAGISAKTLPSTAREQTAVAPASSAKSSVDDNNPLYAPTPAASAFEQVMEIKVAQKTEIRLTLDGKKSEQTIFEPNSYRFTFSDRAEVYIVDASRVSILYNGKDLGVLGNAGRKRRIYFQSKATESDFPK